MDLESSDMVLLASDRGAAMKLAMEIVVQSGRIVGLSACAESDASYTGAGFEHCKAVARATAQKWSAESAERTTVSLCLAGRSVVLRKRT